MIKGISARLAGASLLGLGLLAACGGAGEGELESGSIQAGLTAGETYTLVGMQSGKCVDVAASGKNDGDSIQTGACSGNTNEVAPGALGGTPDGFASKSGLGLSTTTGGGNATPTQVTTCSQLKAALTDSAARVVTVPSGTNIDCRTAARSQVVCYAPCGSSDPNKNWYRIPVTGQTCADLGAKGQTTSTRNETSISVKPNKTLLGLGSGATLTGVSLNMSNTSNIIIRNLTIQNINPHLIEAGDGISINNSHHIWLDHLRIRQVSDGYADVTGSTHVTISRTHFDGRNSYVCGGQHHYVTLVNNSQVTLHHNYFDHTSGRNPKVHGSTARAHVYNNYYDGITYFCIAATSGGQALVEGNSFNNSRYPHWRDGGYMSASSNSYAGTSTGSSQRRDTGDSVLRDVSWYSYSLDSASSIPSNVTGNVGPRKLD